MAVAPGEQKTSILNILRFAASRPSSVRVLVRKIRKRISDGQGRYTAAENEAWIRANAVSSAQLASRLDAALWAEAQQFGRDARAYGEKKLAEVPFDMGAGGDYEFLYWLTRYRKPQVVVETGVSAGWTSRAFLTALARNGGGSLHSSDFPYFRVQNPEQFIGIVVDPALRAGWDLNTDGDERALPRIMAKVPAVNLFHYDSDKSVSGRDFGVGQARAKLAPDGIILVDDILNDSWFREYVEARGEPFIILEGRYGMIGDIAEFLG
jgi:hypothetical protein